MPTLYGIRTIAEESILAAFQAHAADLPGVQLHAGQTDEIRSVPIIILHAEAARSHPDLGGTPLGNFEITFKVYVYSSADDSTLAEHRARVEAAQGIMEDLPALKSAWVQGTLYASWVISEDEGVSDRRWGNLITYNLVAVYPPNP